MKKILLMLCMLTMVTGALSAIEYRAGVVIESTEDRLDIEKDVFEAVAMGGTFSIVGKPVYGKLDALYEISKGSYAEFRLTGGFRGSIALLELLLGFGVSSYYFPDLSTQNSLDTMDAVAEAQVNVDLDSLVLGLSVIGKHDFQEMNNFSPDRMRFYLGAHIMAAF